MDLAANYEPSEDSAREAHADEDRDPSGRAQSAPQSGANCRDRQGHGEEGQHDGSQAGRGELDDVHGLSF